MQTYFVFVDIRQDSEKSRKAEQSDKIRERCLGDDVRGAKTEQKKMDARIAAATV